MSRLELVQALGGVLWVVAIVLLASRRRFVRRLRDAGAVDAATAQTVAAGRLAGFWRRRLSADGVLRTADGERFWLDADAWAAHQRARRRRGLTIAAALAATILMTALAIKVLIGRG